MIFSDLGNYDSWWIFFLFQLLEWYRYVHSIIFFAHFRRFWSCWRCIIMKYFWRIFQQNALPPLSAYSTNAVSRILVVCFIYLFWFIWISRSTVLIIWEEIVFFRFLFFVTTVLHFQRKCLIFSFCIIF